MSLHMNARNGCIKSREHSSAWPFGLYSGAMERLDRYTALIMSVTSALMLLGYSQMSDASDAFLGLAVVGAVMGIAHGVVDDKANGSVNKMAKVGSDQWLGRIGLTIGSVVLFVAVTQFLA